MGIVISPDFLALWMLDEAGVEYDEAQRRLDAAKRKHDRGELNSPWDPRVLLTQYEQDILAAKQPEPSFSKPAHPGLVAAVEEARKRERARENARADRAERRAAWATLAAVLSAACAVLSTMALVISLILR